VAGLRRGDPEAQVQLLNLYDGPLVRFLVHVCRVDVVEAEDVAVEALYRAIDRIDSFVEQPGVGQHGFRNWLFTIARNLWRDRMRRRQSLVRIEDWESLTVPPPNTEPDTSSPTVEAVREALRELPDSHRLTLILHYGGLKLTEVAEILDARPGTVRQWKWRGITELTRLLKDHPALAHLKEETSTTLERDNDQDVFK
jgi:RNA polymerase sigma factor (sigma-70 family)